MDRILYAAIDEKASEFEDACRPYTSQPILKDALASIKAGQYSLTSLASLFRSSPLTLEPILAKTFDPPTSGYSSDCFENDETADRQHSLSFTEVKNLLLDTDVIESLPDNASHTEDPTLVLLLTDILPTADYFSLEKFMVELRNPPEMLKVRFFFLKGKYSLILQFKRKEQARSFQQSCLKKIANFIKTFGSEYKICWAKVNATARENMIAKQRRVLLPVKLYSDSFYGVVLRNLPEKTRIEEIEGFLARKNLQGKVDSLNCLRNEYFCLVLLGSLEQCELAVTLLNDRIISTRVIKAHIHSETSLRRTPGHVQDFLKTIYREDVDGLTGRLAKVDERIEESRLEIEVRRLEETTRSSRRPEYDNYISNHRALHPTESHRALLHSNQSSGTPTLARIAEVYNSKEPDNGKSRDKERSKEKEKDVGSIRRSSQEDRRQLDRETEPSRKHSGRDKESANRDEKSREDGYRKDRNRKSSVKDGREPQRERDVGKDVKHRSDSESSSSLRGEKREKERSGDPAEAGEVRQKNLRKKKKGSESKREDLRETKKGEGRGRSRDVKRKRSRSASENSNKERRRKRTRSRSKDRHKEKSGRDIVFRRESKDEGKRSGGRDRFSGRRESRERRRSSSHGRNSRRGSRDRHRERERPGKSESGRDRRREEGRSSKGKEINKIRALEERIKSRKGE